MGVVDIDKPEHITYSTKAQACIITTKSFDAPSKPHLKMLNIISSARQYTFELYTH